MSRPASPPSLEQCLTLSTYFGERDRTGGDLLADRLLDIYAEQGLRASVLLRGAEGYGSSRLRSDRLLTLSEDLPVVSVALDTPKRIEAALERVLRVKRRGLIALERTRVATGALAASELPGRAEDALRLTIHLGRGGRPLRTPAFVTVCALLQRQGFAGAGALLGVDGTRGARRLRAGFFARNAQVPMMIAAVGSRERVAGVLGELAALAPESLLTLNPVQICKREGILLEAPRALPAEDGRGVAQWQKLTLYSSHATMHEGRPLHAEVIRRLRASGALGVTSLRGVWGFHGEHAPHGDRLLQIRRHVPVLTVAIDNPAGTARSFQIVDELTAGHGLLTCEQVPAMSAVGEGERPGGLELAAEC